MATPPPSSASLAERLVAAACPSCAATIAAEAGLLGTAAECPLCGRGFRLPAAATASPPRRRAAVEAGTGRTAPPGRVAADTGWEGLDSPGAGRAADAGETEGLRRTSAARAARRTRRNVVMLLAGGSILLAIVLLLGRTRR